MKLPTWMIYCTLIIVLTIIAVTSLNSIVPNLPIAYAQYIRLEVSTDKVVYTPIDNYINITGYLDGTGEAKPVSFHVYSPSGKQIVNVTYTIPNIPTEFYFLKIKNNITEFGTYLVTATYDNYGHPIVVNSTFLFSPAGDEKQDGQCKTEYCVYHAELGSVIYPINYKLTSGKLTEIAQNGMEKALLVHIDSNKNGTLTLVLPTSVFDSKDPNGQDLSFQVECFCYGDPRNPHQNVTFHEIKNSTLAAENTRILSIDYLSDYNFAGTVTGLTYQISGTYVVPEFTSAYLAMTLGLVGVIGTSIVIKRISIVPS